MEEEKKKTTFLFVFLTYLPMFLLKFRSGELIGCLHPTSTHLAYFWWTLIPRKQEIPDKCDDDITIMFFRYLFFWGSGVHQKYTLWVLVGCRIKFRIQWALLLRIWVKTQGDMSKIRTKKVVLFYDKYVNSIIMSDSFYWNSIGSWIPTHKIDC